MVNSRITVRAWVYYPSLIVLIIAVIIIWWFCCFNPMTTVLIVRHAEKSASTLNDPPLNAAGQERAKTLVHVTGDANITAVYATQYIRTQQTVQPLAEHLGLTINRIDAEDINGLIDNILSNHSGEVVLLAGHSNTIPQIIHNLGSETVPTIQESEFDNLFLVTVYRFGEANIINLKYGKSE